MSEMIDRVAATINAVAFKKDIGADPRSREMALLVIKAMRQPTMEMVDAGERDGGNSYYRWQAMIDAALSTPNTDKT